MVEGPRDGAPDGLEPRPPSAEDLRDLCRELNRLEARYIVIGGFAIKAAGYERMTVDLDLLVDCAPENDHRVRQALEILPDKAVRELKPGDISEYVVVRVGDEIVVDLMKSACGIEYADAIQDVVYKEIDGVRIPFASPRLLWRMKAPTRREKDLPDLVFLRDLFVRRGEQPPSID